MPEYRALGSLRRTGDLAYGPTPDGPETWQPDVAPLVALPDDSDDIEALVAAARALDEGDATPTQLGLLLRKSADIGGARPKTRIRHDGGDWIAKFPTWSDRFDEPKLEAVCLDVAEAAGIETPVREVVTIRNTSVLLVKRFDRDVEGRPLAYLSAGTLLGEPSSGYGTTRTYADIAEVGRRIGATATAQEMFRRYLVNSSLRNTDDHLRNHHFIRGGADWRLSPVFDVVPSLTVGRHVCAPGPGLSPEWNPASAFAAHQAFRLPEPEAAAIRDDVMQAVGRLDDFMDARKVDPADRTKVREALRPRERRG